MLPASPRRFGRHVPIADHLHDLSCRNAVPRHLSDVVLIENEDRETALRYRPIVNGGADAGACRADRVDRYCPGYMCERADDERSG